jgi:hypothetical protein
MAEQITQEIIDKILAQKQKQIESQKKWREANRQKMNDYHKKYYIEKVKETDKQKQYLKSEARKATIKKYTTKQKELFKQVQEAVKNIKTI